MEIVNEQVEQLSMNSFEIISFDKEKISPWKSNTTAAS